MHCRIHAFRNWLALAFAAWFAPLPGARAQAPDFNRDIRPILSAHCLKCHGPDEKQRQAGLRLDVRSDALRKLASGSHAIRPGKPADSSLVQRIRTNDGGLMPPKTANKPLSESQKRLLERWVATGAQFAPHWAFVAPKNPRIPTLPAELGKRARNPIDHFVFDRLRKAGLAPSPEADRSTLLRRVSLDLTGLPPSPKEINAFLGDKKPGAYERAVDRLLASPRYGERWARRWLDLARYADTNGYEKDRPRSLWPWRDWVIKALNDDMPFDRFTIEQIAGDLLPGATESQRIATGFHRNTMLNEEGGIDPLEYRFLSQVDRVATTGATWLGLTIGCAQCHTHKYDPLPHRDYYRLMAFIDNADEPEIDVRDPAVAKQRSQREAEIRDLESRLPDLWPLASASVFSIAKPVAVHSTTGTMLAIDEAGVVRSRGSAPDKDTVTVSVPGGEGIESVRLDALADAALPGRGPGRSSGGNFVLSKIEVIADGKPVLLIGAEADRSQANFGPEGSLDENPSTGWAVFDPNRPWNNDHHAVFTFDRPVTAKEFRVILRHDFGQAHVLGAFRVALGKPTSRSAESPTERRKRAYRTALARWVEDNSRRAVDWKPLPPYYAKSNMPTLTVQADGSVFSGGDQTKSDVSTFRLKTKGQTIRAIRLEAMADPRLPKNGPGRTEYEGLPGDFFLNEFRVIAKGKPVRLVRAFQSYAAGGSDASKAIDNDMQTAWTIGSGGIGKSQAAVFVLAEPLRSDTIEIQLANEKYYPSNIGRVRFSVTDRADIDGVRPPDAEEVLAKPLARRSSDDLAVLETHFRATAPELAAGRARIDGLRQSLPAYPTTWVFQERPAHDPRTTRVRRRGEFLQPLEAVQPGVPSFLNPMPDGAPRNRLGFARWLVSKDNPLTARVVANRQWQAFFGRGIVTTLDDFGYMGAPPSHPELLDWLAVRFVSDGWSLKKLHRWIVTSSTYRQQSSTDRTRRSKDPSNALLSRGPRVRLDAELVRDTALAAAGLLSSKMYGPSVFPPQPPGVTSEGAYGPLAWNVSQGEDRYRRGLYTFAKRTAPYAMFTTFDAGSGEACLARREVSNTPLQALTLLNDTVFVEAARALGKAVLTEVGDDSSRVETLYQRVLGRRPTSREAKMVLSFVAERRKALTTRPGDAKSISESDSDNNMELAAWTLTARAILNLDEAIVKR